MGHTHVSGIDFDTLCDHPKRKKMGTQKLHFQSKFVSRVAPETIYHSVQR